MGFYTAGELYRVYGDNYKISYYIGERDIRAIANKEFQIVLSDGELEEVEKNIKWNFLNWEALVKTAIAKVLKEEYGYQEGNGETKK